MNATPIVLAGSPRPTGDPLATMPAFESAYSDADVAAVLNFVASRFGAQPSSLKASDVAKVREQVNDR